MRADPPRRFRLVRAHDPSGISGTGLVAWGVRFGDGICAYRWVSPAATTVVAESIEDVIQIHGHGGSTVVEWIDERE